MNSFKQLQTPLDKISQSNSILTEIIRKSAALKKIEALVQKQLSDILGENAHNNPISIELVNGIHVMNFEKGRLHLSCENAAISTRLRYLLPELIHKLRAPKYLPNLITIELKIANTEIVSAVLPMKKNLSSRSSALIKSALALLSFPKK